MKKTFQIESCTQMKPFLIDVKLCTILGITQNKILPSFQIFQRCCLSDIWSLPKNEWPFPRYTLAFPICVRTKSTKKTLEPLSYSLNAVKNYFGAYVMSYLQLTHTDQHAAHCAFEGIERGHELFFLLYVVIDSASCKVA